MSQAVDLEVFYPHSPERVWQVLTDRRALAAWMMENDFEPKLGHKFRFYSQPLPGLKTTILCEVVELEEPTRLVYTWQESSASEASLVVWTLTTVLGGTQLRLKHHQYSYTTAVAALNSGKVTYPHTSAGLSHAKPFSTSASWETLSYYSNTRNRTRSYPSGQSTTLELPQFQSFNWNYFLNQSLPQVLGQDVILCN